MVKDGVNRRVVTPGLARDKAPSEGALTLLEQAARNPKWFYKDIVPRVLLKGSDVAEEEEMKRERMSVEEIREMLERYREARYQPIGEGMIQMSDFQFPRIAAHQNVTSEYVAECYGADSAQSLHVEEIVELYEALRKRFFEILERFPQVTGGQDHGDGDERAGIADSGVGEGGGDMLVAEGGSDGGEGSG